MELNSNLEIDRCPHCSIARPNLEILNQYSFQHPSHGYSRIWATYVCKSCTGIVSAWSFSKRGPVVEYFPTVQSVDKDVPEKPKAYLEQAIASIHAPAGAIMLCASSVDSMLKIKGYTTGSLHHRIELAAKNHLITDDMSKWAHAVRLDANDQRHADSETKLPDEKDANRCIDFTQALAQFLFVLPARIVRGLEK